MDKALEKSIIRRWGLLRQQCLFEDELVHMKQEVALELLHAEMRHMKYAHTQVDLCVRKRNELACHIMRRFFAPALIRCLEGAKETMSPGERLLLPVSNNWPCAVMSMGFSKRQQSGFFV
jgi:hypothetical protein